MIPNPRPLSLHTAALAAFLLALTGCGGGGSQTARKETLQIKGSDTMVNVVQAWAEAYATVDTTLVVEVSGGGSGVGIAALSRGTVQIASASRNLKAEEVASTRQNTGVEPMDFVVGYDALAVFVHRDNPLDEISIDQLARIFAEDGTVTKWSEIGVQVPGTSDEIVRVSRQSSSGTYEFFREHVLGEKDFKLGSRDMSGSKEVVELIGLTPSAIGYSGMGYATHEVKMLRIAVHEGEPAVPPTVENALDRSYPLARSLHLYTLGAPEGAAKRFIDWTLSPDGQRIVQESGYVPLPSPAAPAAPAE